MQTKKGQSIEDASMQMIEDEIGTHQYNEREWPIVRRIIHSTADFDFADKISLSFFRFFARCKLFQKMLNYRSRIRPP